MRLAGELCIDLESLAARTADFDGHGDEGVNDRVSNKRLFGSIPRLRMPATGCGGPRCARPTYAIMSRTIGVHVGEPEVAAAIGYVSRCDPIP